MPRLVVIVLVCLPSFAVSAQTIVQSRGADARVDYASLTLYGPWDDRNYALTRDDIALLGVNEAELDNMIPAFFRVELRRKLGVSRTSRVPYPLSELPTFNLNYGGYLVDGKLYRSARRREDGHFEVLFENAVDYDDYTAEPKGLFFGEARVTNPSGAAESALAINPVDPNLVIAGTNGPGGGQRMHYSTDGGATWSQVSLPLGGSCCDPTVGWSSDGSFAYTATLNSSFDGLYFYRSSNGGQSWDDLANEPGNDPRRFIGDGFGTDKEFLHVDIAAGSPHKDNIYMTWHRTTVLRFARSTDNGHTWSAPLVFSSDPLGLGSDLTSDGAGNIYNSYAAYDDQTIVVKKSMDGGLTFAPAVVVDTTQASFNFAIPSQETRKAVTITSTDADRSGGPFDGSVYVVWNDITAPAEKDPESNHVQVKVAYSRDGGDTWTTTIPHETNDVDSVDRWQPWVSVGPDGRVYVAFYDTRNDPSRTSVDLYFNVSEDGAQTWATPRRLTTVSSPNIDDAFEFGDFNGLDVDMQKLMASFTDNRDESGGDTPSKDVYVVGFEGVSSEIFTDGFESGDTSLWTR